MRFTGRIWKDGEFWLVPTVGEYVEVGSRDTATLTAFLLKRARTRHGISLSEAARRMGQTSKNAYSRYERGVAVPTVQKLTELLDAINPGDDIVIGPSRAA